MSEQTQSSFSGWAKVEVMGHQSHVGYVRTEAYGQAVLFRIDTPEIPEREYVLTEPAYTDTAEGLRSWTRAGAKVLRLATPGLSVLVGSGSIYRIIPCTEAVALKAIEEGARSPLKLVELPPQLAIETSEGSEEEGEEVCDTCGRPEGLCYCGGS